jgi:hypothetical protein
VALIRDPGAARRWPLTPPTRQLMALDRLAPGHGDAGDRHDRCRPEDDAGAASRVGDCWGCWSAVEATPDVMGCSALAEAYLDATPARRTTGSATLKQASRASHPHQEPEPLLSAGARDPA